MLGRQAAPNWWQVAPAAVGILLRDESVSSFGLDEVAWRSMLRVAARRSFGVVSTTSTADQGLSVFRPARPIVFAAIPGLVASVVVAYLEGSWWPVPLIIWLFVLPGVCFIIGLRWWRRRRVTP